MKKKEEIISIVENKANYAEFSLEVLLDIRDLLVKLLAKKK